MTTQPVLLGYGPMDAMHGEFETLVAAARVAGDADLHERLLRVRENLLAHFGQEDAWMRKNAFPAADCHIDEHAKVLASAEEVLPLVAAGRHEVGRSFIAALADWFPGHADYLDSALAAWLCKRQYGGRPVVIQRRTIASTQRQTESGPST
jgi:hemerythrin